MLSKSLTDGKSLIYIKNSRGPKIEPWGTPVYIFSVMISTHLDEQIEICLIDNYGRDYSLNH